MHKIINFCLFCLFLTGCDLLPVDPAKRPLKPLPLMSVQSFNNWLAISNQMQGITEQQAEQQLMRTRTPQTEEDLFRFGLLNQQLNRLDGWVQARDTFRKLAQNEALEQGFRELARIYQVHNQAQINWHERHRGLQREVVETMIERDALEKKIQALTELEETISDRKQQLPAPKDRATANE